MYKGLITLKELKNRDDFDNIVDSIVYTYGLSKYAKNFGAERYSRESIAQDLCVTKGTIDSVLRYAREHGYDVRNRKIMESDKEKFFEELEKNGINQTANDWKISKNYAKKLMKASSIDEKVSKCYSTTRLVGGFAPESQPVAVYAYTQDGGKSKDKKSEAASGPNMDKSYVPPGIKRIIKPKKWYKRALPYTATLLAGAVAIVGLWRANDYLDKFLLINRYGRMQREEQRLDKKLNETYTDAFAKLGVKIDGQNYEISKYKIENKDLKERVKACQDNLKKYSAKKHKKPAAAKYGAKKQEEKAATPPPATGIESKVASQEQKSGEEKFCGGLTIKQQWQDIERKEANRSYGIETSYNRDGSINTGAKDFDANYNPANFKQRVGRDFKDAYDNVKEDGKGIGKTAIEIIKMPYTSSIKMLDGITFGIFNKKGNQPKGMERIFYPVTQIYKAAADPFIDGNFKPVAELAKAPQRIVKGVYKVLTGKLADGGKELFSFVGKPINEATHTLENLADGGTNVVEGVIFDTTIGNIPLGEKATSAVFDATQVVGSKIARNIPGGDDFNKVIGIRTDKGITGYIPVVNNIVNNEEDTCLEKTIDTVFSAAETAGIIYAGTTSGGGNGDHGGEVHYESIGGPDVGGN